MFKTRIFNDKELKHDNKDINRAWFVTLIQDIIIGLVLFIALFFTIELDYVDGGSMRPTLDTGNVFVSLKVKPNKEYGTIVSVYLETDNSKITKRIIGRGGDEINLIDGVVYRNGIPLDEPYVSSPTYATGDISFPVVVPYGSYFVLGDNREMSKDSRFSDIGLVPDENITASYLFLLPWTAHSVS